MSWIEEAKAEVDRKMGKAKSKIEEITFFTELEMDKLFRFQHDIDYAEWERLFIEADGTKGMAEHLWSKFHGYDHQILKLWVDLDIKNRDLVLAMINKWVREH